MSDPHDHIVPNLPIVAVASVLTRNQTRATWMRSSCEIYLSFSKFLPKCRIKIIASTWISRTSWLNVEPAPWSAVTKLSHHCRMSKTPSREDKTIWYHPSRQQILEAPSKVTCQWHCGTDWRDSFNNVNFATTIQPYVLIIIKMAYVKYLGCSTSNGWDTGGADWVVPVPQ